MPFILAMEASCDETSAAICADGKILSNFIANQTVHDKYGGVVPEWASRAHMQHIIQVVDAALKQANCRLKDIDAVAFTQSPGLIGSLLVGGQFAKSLALALNKPLIDVHHMQAHVLANLIDDPKPSFPFLCLTVSGGHTQIVHCESPTNMTVIGVTIDDAANFFMHKILIPHYEIDELESLVVNFKSKIIEWSQKNGHELRFDLLEELEQKGKRMYKMGLMFNGELIAEDIDYSKKRAEQKASEHACRKLGIHE